MYLSLIPPYPDSNEQLVHSTDPRTHGRERDRFKFKEIYKTKEKFIHNFAIDSREHF